MKPIESSLANRFQDIIMSLSVELKCNVFEKFKIKQKLYIPCFWGMMEEHGIQGCLVY